MDKKRLAELGLDEAMAQKIIEAIEKEQEHDGFVPRDRLNSESEKRKEAESKIKTLADQLSERDKQLDELAKKNPESESLKNQIEELKKENADKDNKIEEAEKEHAAKIKTLARSAIDDRILSNAKAKNMTAAKALLKSIDEELDDEKYAAEREKEIKELLEKEDSKFMFGDGSAGGLSSHKPGNSGGDPGTTISIGELAAKRINQERNPTKE